MKALLLLPLSFALFALPTNSPDHVTPLGEHDWVVDPVHSSVVFKVKHAKATWFFGTFDKIEGKVSLDPAKPEAGSVSLTIPVDSVDTNDAKRDDHLKQNDFFGAKENPEITFKSTKIAKQGEGYEVTGDLELAGKSKSVTMWVERTGEGEFYGRRIGFLSAFTIKRSDFGMMASLKDGALGDEVTLQIGLECIQPK